MAKHCTRSGQINLERKSIGGARKHNVSSPNSVIYTGLALLRLKKSWEGSYTYADQSKLKVDPSTRQYEPLNTPIWYHICTVAYTGIEWDGEKEYVINPNIMYAS